MRPFFLAYFGFQIAFYLKLLLFISPGTDPRFAQANIDVTRRAGELTDEEVKKITTVMQKPTQYTIPWFLNRQRDYKNRKTIQ
ncbi:hypothetical protein DXG03_000731, partial [Asterophora parasitica]